MQSLQRPLRPGRVDGDILVGRLEHARRAAQSGPSAMLPMQIFLLPKSIKLITESNIFLLFSQ